MTAGWSGFSHSYWGYDPMSWIDQARDGDSHALIDGLEQCLPLLRAEAQRLLRDCPRLDLTADELVHEVYLRAYVTFGQFHSDSQASWCSWLKKILTNALMDHLRRRSRRADGPIGDLGLSRAVDREHTPRRQAEIKEMAGAIRQAVKQLNPGKRLVFEMHVLDDIPLPVIAELLDRNYDAILRRFQRARAEIRSVLHLSGSTYAQS